MSFPVDFQAFMNEWFRLLDPDFRADLEAIIAEAMAGGGGGGDVVGPASAVDSNFAAFDGITGKLIKDSGYSPSDFVSQVQLFDQTFDDEDIKAWGTLTPVGDFGIVPLVSGAIGILFGRVDYDFSNGAYSNLSLNIQLLSDAASDTERLVKNSDITALLAGTTAGYLLSTPELSQQNVGFSDSKTNLESGINIMVYQPPGAFTDGGTGNYIRIRLWYVPTAP